eukprot:GGOE01004588.1.p1 GENE.GGOE01004588.1~~GGOE01004588.1.p1  ORF type:complete len:372 (+),score=30.88 GGOE01004588.1:91-1116(+)
MQEQPRFGARPPRFAHLPSSKVSLSKASETSPRKRTASVLDPEVLTVGLSSWSLSPPNTAPSPYPTPVPPSCPPTFIPASCTSPTFKDAPVPPYANPPAHGTPSPFVITTQPQLSPSPNPLPSNDAASTCSSPPAELQAPAAPDTQHSDAPPKVQEEPPHAAIRPSRRRTHLLMNLTFPVSCPTRSVPRPQPALRRPRSGASPSTPPEPESTPATQTTTPAHSPSSFAPASSTGKEVQPVAPAGDSQLSPEESSWKESEVPQPDTPPSVQKPPSAPPPSPSTVDIEADVQSSGGDVEPADGVNDILDLIYSSFVTLPSAFADYEGPTPRGNVAAGTVAGPQ